MRRATTFNRKDVFLAVRHELAGLPKKKLVYRPLRDRLVLSTDPKVTALVEQHGIRLVAQTAVELADSNAFDISRKNHALELETSKSATNPTWPIDNSDRSLPTDLDDFEEPAAVIPSESSPTNIAGRKRSGAGNTPALQPDGQKRVSKVFNKGSRLVYRGGALQRQASPVDAADFAKSPIERRPLQVLRLTQLPHSSQYELFLRVQTILEEACFDFAKRRLPNELIQRDWDSPAAGELGVWCNIFRKCPIRFDEELPAGQSGQTVSLVFDAMTGLRNLVINRSKIRGEELQQLLLDAELFCRMLNDPGRLEVLTEIREHVQATVTGFVEKQEVLHARAVSIREKFASQQTELYNKWASERAELYNKWESERAELRKIETPEIDHLLEQNQTLLESAGKDLEKGLRRILQPKPQIEDDEPQIGDNEPQIEAEHSQPMAEPDHCETEQQSALVERPSENETEEDEKEGRSESESKSFFEATRLG